MDDHGVGTMSEYHTATTALVKIRLSTAERLDLAHRFTLMFSDYIKDEFKIDDVEDIAAERRKVLELALIAEAQTVTGPTPNCFARV